MEVLFQGREKAYDEAKEIPQRINLTEYTDFYINVETLFRNMYSSIDASEAERIADHVYADYIITEIDVIKSLMQIEGQGICELLFYTSSQAKILKKVTDTKLAEIKTPTTSKQMIYNTLKIATLEILKKRLPEIKHFNDSLTLAPTNKKVLIFTHNALDLLSYGKFAKFDLLESHTGVIKNKLTFYTKYASHSALTPLPPIPFCSKLLVIFGDKDHVKMSVKSAREQVIALAIKCGWSPLTTLAKLDYDIDKIKDPVIQQLVKNM